MGNQLLPNYTIEEKPQSYGGYSKLWKIHNAVKIGRGKEQVSIFIFDKRSLDKMGIKGAQKEEIVKLLRQEANNLAQLKSPLVLQLIEPINEDPKRIVFVTERIQGSLSQFISSGDIVKQIQSELDIKIHLLELIEGISFLHSDARMVHLGISPENIYVIQNGKWRLGGLVFSSQLSNEDLNETSIDFSPKPYESQLKLYPNLPYCGPELTESPPKMCFKSDIFSFGMLLINLLRYKTEKSLTDFNIFEVDTIYAHRNNFDSLSNLLEKQPFYQQATGHVKQLLMSVIRKNLSARPTLNQIHQSEFFMDPLVQSINHLSRLDQMDIQQQQAFITNLAKLFMKVIFVDIVEFEIIVVKGTILPRIMPLIKNEQLMVQVTSILVELLKAQDYLTKVEFNNLVWTHVKTVSQAQQVPAKCLYQFVSHLPDLYKLVQPDEIQGTLIPLYLKCLECNVFKLQEVALGVTDCIVGRIDYVYTKNKILPRLLQMCLDQNIQTRTAAIATLRKIHQVFDKQSVNDLIFPTIEKMRKLGFMNKDLGDIIFEIYSVFCEQMTNEVLISKGIPSLLPYLMESGLTKSQVSQFGTLIKSLVAKIETYQLKFLKDEQPQQVVQAPVYIQQSVPEIKQADDSDFGQFNQKEDQQSSFNFNFDQVKFDLPTDFTQNRIDQVQAIDPFSQSSFSKVQNQPQVSIISQFSPPQEQSSYKKPESNIFDFDAIDLKPLPQNQQFTPTITQQPTPQKQTPTQDFTNQQLSVTKVSDDLFQFDQPSNLISAAFSPPQVQKNQQIQQQLPQNNFSFQAKDQDDPFTFNTPFNKSNQAPSSQANSQQIKNQIQAVPQIKTDILEINFGDNQGKPKVQDPKSNNKYDDLFNMDSITNEPANINPSLIEKPQEINIFNGFDNFSFKKDYLPFKNESKKIDNDWGF